MLRLLFCSFVASACAIHVEIPGLGIVKGTVGAPAVRKVAFFGGIPYAKPPIGALRWQPPVPHGPFDSPRNAGWLDVGHQCSEGLGPLHGREDCLFLNIATPRRAVRKQESLPVMIFIHGGSYEAGSGNMYTPFTTEMVDRSGLSVLCITINYRLGVFGFLASAELMSRSADNGAGNLGIQDQRLSMQWVKEHIGAFGGNGEAITIFGESAGANSVFNHLAHSASSPFFSRAIIESGAFDEGAMSMDVAEAQFQRLKTEVGCEDLDCLLATDALTIAGTVWDWCDAVDACWGPVVDGVSLTATPAALIDAGTYNFNAQVIIGSNRDEKSSGFFDVGQLPANLNESSFDSWMQNRFSFSAAQLVEVKSLYDPAVYQYPANLGKHSQWWWTGTRMATDEVPGLGACGTRWLARMLARGGSEVYAYFFARPCQSLFLPASHCHPGSKIAPHAGEITYAFGDHLLTLPPQDRALATEMSHYWTSFAASGVPSVTGQPNWPAYDPESDTVLRLDVRSDGGIVEQSKTRESVCDWWDNRFGASSKVPVEFI